jgi:hypothetical protein
MHIADRSLVVGQPARVSGRIGRSNAGRTVVLEHRARGGQWSRLATATVDDRGRYGMRQALAGPGTVRVVLEPAPGTATASAAAPTSRESAVSVAPAIGIASRRLQLKAGRTTAITGSVASGAKGIPVSLQIRRGAGWRRLDGARTGPGGRFELRDRVRRPVSAPLRVAVAGHNGLSTSRRVVGRLDVYRYTHASWYGPGLYGFKLGCGGRLHPGTLGVAHKSLPCGTRVSLRHGGRTIRVRVIDRGPYVGGREYDLTAATARRIGFSGHGSLLVTR